MRRAARTSMPRGGFLRRGCLSAILVAVAASAPAEITAQSYRGWVASSFHMVELRPVGVDTIPRSSAVESPDGEFTFDGYSVDCGASTCSGLLPLAKERTFLATQDVGLTYWALGVQGLSLTGLVRVRSDLGGDAAWPRYDDDFDAILGYAQLVRGPIRVRAGRQEIRSGLGFAGFDGVSGSFDQGRLRVGAYGGRSLARGLREPTNEAVRGLRDFFVDKGVYILGASATGRHGAMSVTGRYQREILSDRSGLESERASLDVATTLPFARLRGSLDYDFVFRRAGKGELTLSAPFDEGTWLVEVSGRRYVPYFQLSTIWGFFEPVSYHEARARVGWSGTSTLAVWVGGGIRTYGDTQTPIVLQPLEDTGWRGDASARWEFAPGWTADATYQIEWGSGAFLSSADARLRFQATDRVGAAITMATFQQIEEYRLGEGRAFGLGGTLDVQATDRVDVLGGFSVTRHRDGGTVFTSPWNQSRAWTSLRWTVGQDPGLANRGGRR